MHGFIPSHHITVRTRSVAGDLLGSAGAHVGSAEDRYDPVSVFGIDVRAALAGYGERKVFHLEIEVTRIVSQTVRLLGVVDVCVGVDVNLPARLRVAIVAGHPIASDRAVDAVHLGYVGALA